MRVLEEWVVSKLWHPRNFRKRHNALQELPNAAERSAQHKVMLQHEQLGRKEQRGTMFSAQGCCGDVQLLLMALPLAICLYGRSGLSRPM